MKRIFITTAELNDTLEDMHRSGGVYLGTLTCQVLGHLVATADAGAIAEALDTNEHATGCALGHLRAIVTQWEQSQGENNETQ